MLVTKDPLTVKSRNFEFLRPKRAVLADLAAFAELYAHSDPSSSLIKQRGFVEQVVHAIYEGYRLRAPFTDNLNDLLGNDDFKQAVPEVVQQKLHAVRIAGNHAAHPRRPMTSQLALERLYQTFEIAEWLHIQVDRGTRASCPVYAPPGQEAGDNGKTRETLERLRLAETRYQSAIDGLETARRERAEAEAKRSEAEQAARQSSQALEQLRVQGQAVASALAFSEAETRHRLIDQQLLDAGWNVGAQGARTDEVQQEVPVTTMRTTSGEGYADYVLHGDDGKPLAVVEAKKTAKDARQGQEQARLYADCLQKEQGQRPVIFYTNGIDIFLWDDAQGYGPRKIHGFYSKDSLEYLIHQRGRKQLTTVAPSVDIAGRIYQLEAIKRVCERLADRSRRALLVQATGTGKTRVAISLCDLLMRAGWAKRILFLCDRRELRKQADNAFKEFLPGEPRVVVDSRTSSDRDKRVYLATYPAMIECYEQFDVGFFDLVIADESHRSIYKKFRALFQYFDAVQIGLTATPVKFIERNTYQLFECKDRDPTAHYSLEDAINAKPPYLTPFRVREFETGIRTDGLRYSSLNEEQREQLEEQDEAPQLVSYAPKAMDRDVFNKDTTRYIWRTLMNEGIQDATGGRVGKTIVFARNHDHAMHLLEVFEEMYKQYGGSFCRVIDNQEPRRDQLIDDFKDPKNELTIAISVDMLDTGIDVPQVVNLVFAKQMKSYVKFWQMIGRGTRLCPDLFGPGRDKTEFLIFDHWKNFWYFDVKYKEKQPSAQKSLLQHIFESRVALAEIALNKMDEPLFQRTVDLLVQDVCATKDVKSIDVKERWRELELLAERERIAQFAAATKTDLLNIAGPLMHWRSIRGDEDAYRFDLLLARAEVELLRGGAGATRFLDLKARIEDEVERLSKNQNPVKAKAASIGKVRSPDFWAQVTVPALEELRLDLRGIMKYQQETLAGGVGPRVYDITDDRFTAADYVPKLAGLELVEYRRRVESVLAKHFEGNPVLQKVRAGSAVREDELESLAVLVLRLDDRANVKHLVGYQPETRRSLLAVFRGLVGLDPVAVERAFTGFVHKHPGLSSQQLRFLQLLQNHIAQNGGIEVERLYEPPFTTVHAESVDGVFPNTSDVDELLAILETFQIKTDSPTPPTRQAL